MPAKTLTLFNHKGGVGKTTLTVNLADAFAERGFRVLVVDTDPQCNISAFYLEEETLDEMLNESSSAAPSEGYGTVWAAVRPIVDGDGRLAEIQPVEIVEDRIALLVGDILLSQFEEFLAIAWTESRAGMVRGYKIMSTLSQLAHSQAKSWGADIIIYDVGPNVGALNRAVLLSSDFFATPVHTDLYSLRALATVGQSLSRWIKEWQRIKSESGRKNLLLGKPKYLGYISTAFKQYGRSHAKAHEHWERRLPPRVRHRLVEPLKAVDPLLVELLEGGYKVGNIKHFASAPASAQKKGVPIRQLTEAKFAEHASNAKKQFGELADKLLQRMGLREAK